MIEWYHLGFTYGDVIFRRDGYICLYRYSSCIACPSEVDPHREAVLAWRKDIPNAVVWEESSRLKLLIATYICFLFSTCNKSWTTLNLQESWCILGFWKSVFLVVILRTFESRVIFSLKGAFLYYLGNLPLDLEKRALYCVLRERWDL